MIFMFRCTILHSMIPLSSIIMIYSAGIIRLQPIHYDQLTRESDIFHFQTEIDLNEKTIQTISVPDNIAYTFCKPNLLVLQELFSFLAAFWLATFKRVILECDFSLFNALKYYSATDADGKTFILVFCVLQIDSTQLFTRCKRLGQTFFHLQRLLISTLIEQLL